MFTAKAQLRDRCQSQHRRSLPGHVVGLGGDPGVTSLAIYGAAIVMLGVLTLVPTLAGRAGGAPSDPYEGHTLEWVAASPPPRHNFDELPPVHSPHPLHDSRSAS